MNSYASKHVKDYYLANITSCKFCDTVDVTNTNVICVGLCGCTGTNGFCLQLQNAVYSGRGLPALIAVAKIPKLLWI